MNHFLTYEKCPSALCVIRFTSRIMQSEKARSCNVLRSQPVNSAVPRQCSAKRFTVVLWRVLSRVWTCLWTRARYPSSSFTNSVLSGRHLSQFSDTFLLSRPTTACCAWIDDLLTLVWQMLSSIINVASLGAMIHDAVGISRCECSSEGPRGLTLFAA